MFLQLTFIITIGIIINNKLEKPVTNLYLKLICFLLYYNTISKFVLKLLNKIIGFIVFLIKKTIIYISVISESLYYMIVYMLHFLLDTIFFIPNLFLATKKVIKRKPRIKLKVNKKS